MFHWTGVGKSFDSYRLPWLLIFERARRMRRINRSWSFWRFVSFVCWPRDAIAHRYKSPKVVRPTDGNCQLGFALPLDPIAGWGDRPTVRAVPDGEAFRFVRSASLIWMFRIRKYRMNSDITDGRLRLSDTFEFVHAGDVEGDDRMESGINCWKPPIRFRFARNKCCNWPISLAFNWRASLATCCTDIPLWAISLRSFSVDRRRLRDPDTGAGADVDVDVDAGDDDDNDGTTWSLTLWTTACKSKQNIYQYRTMVKEQAIHVIELQTFFHFSFIGVSSDIDWRPASTLPIVNSGTKWSVLCWTDPSIIAFNWSRTWVAVNLFSGFNCSRPLIICSVAFDISQFL